MHDGMDGHGHGHHGRGRHHGRGGGGGRVFGPGDLRLVLLSLLAEQPRHGYELIKAIEGLFDGTYSPSPGSVYPTLTLLEELGQIAPVDTGTDGGRKPLALTETGRAWIAENADAMELAVSRMRFAARAMAKRNIPDGVIQSMHMLKAALAFHPVEWTDAEVTRVRGVLDAAVKQITG